MLETVNSDALLFRGGYVKVKGLCPIGNVNRAEGMPALAVKSFHPYFQGEINGPALLGDDGLKLGPGAIAVVRRQAFPSRRLDRWPLVVHRDFGAIRHESFADSHLVSSGLRPRLAAPVD